MYKEELQKLTQEAIEEQDLKKYDWLLTRMMEDAKEGKWQTTFHFLLTDDLLRFLLENDFVVRGRDDEGVWRLVTEKPICCDNFIVSWR
jgi:hypothetical protein